ncbi:kinase-like domain-containing protein [Earliella scabrosa]|nr:kinase-like domain-containing protein [Earliella scabrosa]
MEQNTGMAVAVKVSQSCKEEEESLENEGAQEMSRYGGKGFFGDVGARKVAMQVASGIDYIKTENIVFTQRSAVETRKKISSTTWTPNDHGFGLVGSNQYRAPEVSLGLPWDKGIDAFGLGCVMAEIWIGTAIFPLTDSVVERIAAVERVVGRVSPQLVRRAGSSFADMFRVSDDEISIVFTRRNVADAIRHRRVRSLKHILDIIVDKGFATTCLRLLCPDPDDRMSVESFLTEIARSW